jgi:hypothetical protein
MSYSATKIKLGTIATNERVVVPESGNPATFKAGLFVRRTTAGELSLASGSPIGVSVGGDMSGGDKITAVCEAGLGVPVRVVSDGSVPAIGAQCYIAAAATHSGEGNYCSSNTASATAVNAVMRKTGMTLVDDDGTEYDGALIDFIGGL